MSRFYLNYSEPGSNEATFSGFSTLQPTPGFYKIRLTKGGHYVGVRIWFGPPHDPVTGEEMDRSWRWQASANGRYIEIDRVWPRCGRDPISQAEHDYLANLQSWAEVHAPNSPQADPRKPIDLLRAPLPF